MTLLLLSIYSTLSIQLMDHEEDENSSQLAVLCQRLGRLCSKQEIEVRNDESSPWLFSSHLVVFKSWILNTPLHCYNFSTCTFWVQVFGLPLEWYTSPFNAANSQHRSSPPTASYCSHQHFIDSSKRSVLSSWCSAE